MWFRPVLLAAAFASPLVAAEPIPITGLVTALESKPVAGARASLLPLVSEHEAARLRLAKASPEPAATATTDAAGRFRLAAPHAGMWRVVVAAEGSASETIDVAPLVGPVLLPPLVLIASTRITVEVVDAAGKPVAGAEVEAIHDPEGDYDFGDRWREPAWSPSPVGATSGPDGKALLTVRPDHWLAVRAAAPGRAAAAVRSPAGTAKPILSPGCPRTLEITQAGRPVAGAIATHLGFPAGPTDAQGRLTMTLPCAGARLDVSLAGSATAAIDAPQGDQPVRVQLAPLRFVRGTVRDERTGRPVAGAFVWPAGEPSAAVATDSGGAYQAVLPRADRPRLHAAAAGYFPTIRAAPTSGAEPLPGPDLALTPAVTLTGSVVDQAGQGLDGAQLIVVPADGAPASPQTTLDLPAATDAAGRFSLRLLPEVEAEVVARHAGFAPLRHAIPRLRAGETPPPLRLVLGQGVTAFGRVVDGSGKPVPQATVSLSLAEPAEHDRVGWLLLDPEGVKAATDPAGAFRFERLPALRIDLAASAPDFAPTVVRGLSVPQEKARFDLGTVVLRQGERVSGRVVDTGGAPLSDVTVALMPMLSNPSLADDSTTVVTGGDGRFAFSGLAPGMAALSAEKEGYGQAELSLLEIPTSDPVEVLLKPTLQIACRVVDEAGRPAADATVNARSLGEEALDFDPRTRVDDRGDLVIELPGPGRYELVAAAPGLLSASRVIDVGADGLPGGVSFTLTSGAVVYGKVEGPDGLPLPEAVVSPLASQEDEVSWSFAMSEMGKADGDGGYRITGLRPGRRSFAAQRQGFRRQVRDLEVRPGENRLDFRLEAGVPVSGRVVDRAGAPIAGAQVSLQGGLSQTEQVSSSTDGGFTVSGVSPGTYRLFAHRSGYADKWVEGIHVAGDPVSGLEVTLGPTGSIRGRVLGIDFAALSTVQVMASGEASSTRAAVDFEGNYQLDGLAPGEWTVMAMAGTRVQQGRVTVQPGAEAMLDLEFSPGFRLTGRVVAAGSPAAGALVALAARESGGGGFTTTAADGSFRFEGLAAGTYELIVQARTGAFRSRKTIELAGDTELTIEASEASVSGQVVDSAGEPLPGVQVILQPQGDPTFGGASSTTTDPEGRFVLRGATEGPHKLLARREGYGTVETPLEVSASGVEGLRLTLPAAASLVLAIAGPAGVAPDWVFIALLDPAGGTAAAGSYVTGERGRVEINSAGPGSYRLLAAGSDTAVAELAVHVPGGPVPVALVPAARVTVRVVPLAGSAFGGEVTVSDRAGRPFRSLSGVGVNASWNLQQGTATVTQLPAGVWRFHVEAPGGKSWDREVTVRSGETAELVIE